jgi:uncharacterized membrane protein YraQ (UPF0718 family)
MALHDSYYVETARSLLASTLSVAVSEDVTPAATSSTATTFEPMMPDATALVGLALVVLLSIITAWVWADQVVPVSRTKLAISKKSGAVREYLDELEVAGNVTEEASALLITNEDRAFERWLFTDWLENRKRESGSSKPGRQKEPALPVLKDAKWNSGDNPVLVASALIGAGVLVTAFTERVASTVL